MDLVMALKLISGTVFILFLPGFVWSFVFFKKEEIDVIERITFSFGLSIAIVPMSTFWLNYFLGVKITLLNVSLMIFALIALAGVLIKKRDKIEVIAKRLKL